MTTEVAECVPGPTMHLRFLRLFATLDFCKIVCDLRFFVRLFVLLNFLVRLFVRQTIPHPPPARDPPAG